MTEERSLSVNGTRMYKRVGLITSDDIFNKATMTMMILHEEAVKKQTIVVDLMSEGSHEVAPSRRRKKTSK